MTLVKPADHALRMERALLSLEGLSVGDAFGERFFLPLRAAASAIEARALPPAPWSYTDDTEMALAIVQVLEEHGRIEQNALASVFAARYFEDRYPAKRSSTTNGSQGRPSRSRKETWRSIAFR